MFDRIIKQAKTWLSESIVQKKTEWNKGDIYLKDLIQDK